MPLIKSIHDDRRYSLLLRSRQPSVAEISTTNSAKKSFQKKNKQKEEDDNATCCTASTASSSLSASSSTSSSSVSSLRSTNKKKNKSVSFAPYVDIHETIALADMTQQEHRDCWYTKKQLKEIKVVLTQTVRMMVSGKLDQDTDEYCARGLDIRTTAGCAKRRQNKRMGWDAVLNEQSKQYEKAMQRKQQQHEDDDDDDDSSVDSRLVLDDEAIATAFIQANLHCRKAALMNGLRDELQSLRINNLTRNIKSIMNNNNNNNSKNEHKKDDAAATITKATLALNVLRKRNETATKRAPSSSSSSSSFPTKTLRKYFLKRTMRKGTRDSLLQEIHNQRTATTTTTRKQQQQQQQQ